MAYEIEAGFENICRKILESSRNALYINMRYLDVTLSSLAWEITTDIPRIGTDGLKIAYEPGVSPYGVSLHFSASVPALSGRPGAVESVL